LFTKMVAKQASDRYQNMTEVIAALEASLGDASSSSSSVTPEVHSEDSKLSEFLKQQKSISRPGADPLPAAKPSAAQALASKTNLLPDATIALAGGLGDTDPKSSMSLSVAGESGVSASVSPAAKPAVRGVRKEPPLLLIGSAAGAGLALLVLGVVLLWPTARGTVSIEITDPEIEVKLDQDGAKITAPGNQKIKVKAGQHGLTVKHGKLEFTTDKFELKKGDTLALKVELLSGKLQVSHDGKVLGSLAVPGPTAVGSAIPVSDYALEFDGNDKVEVESLKLPRSGPLTLEGYVTLSKLLEGKITGNILGVQSQLDLNLIGKGSLRATIFPEGQKKYFSQGTKALLTIDRKTHVATVWNGTQFLLFMDGKQIARADGILALKEPSTLFSLGEHLVGRIGEVRVSKVARYDRDFLPEPRFTPDKDTVALYHCDEGSGEVLADSSGNNHHGKIVGAKWVKAAGAAMPPGTRAPTPATAPFDAAQAKQHQAAGAAFLNVQVEHTNSLQMKLVYIPPGEFEMGSPVSEKDRKADEKLHHAKLTQGFYLGAHEVTQGQFEAVLGRNPSSFKTVSGQDTKLFPVEMVSWFDAIEFCNALSMREGLPEYYALQGATRKDGAISGAQVTVKGGAGYRLPSEAQWEYACRAGSKQPFHFGDVLNGTEANVDGGLPYGTTTQGTNLKRTCAVGSYPANTFGLCDMHGNVWEWCEDWHGGDAGDAGDPKGPVSGTVRVLRGGSWLNYALIARAAYRFGHAPDYRSYFTGFRLARTP